ncbi:hypothetical protein D3C85_1050390 [compost metagenome]
MLIQVGFGQISTGCPFVYPAHFLMCSRQIIIGILQVIYDLRPDIGIIWLIKNGGGFINPGHHIPHLFQFKVIMGPEKSGLSAQTFTFIIFKVCRLCH